MYWYENMYMDNSIMRLDRWNKLDKLIDKIEAHKVHKEVHLIVLPTSSDTTLEIIPSRNFLQKSYPMDNLMVVGLCGDSGSAMAMTEQILLETYEAQHDMDVERFMDDRVME